MPNDGRPSEAIPCTVEALQDGAKLQKEHSFGHTAGDGWEQGFAANHSIFKHLIPHPLKHAGDRLR
jgi:hypothetical protein